MYSIPFWQLMYVVFQNSQIRNNVELKSIVSSMKTSVQSLEYVTKIYGTQLFSAALYIASMSSLHDFKRDHHFLDKPVQMFVYFQCQRISVVSNESQLNHSLYEAYTYEFCNLRVTFHGFWLIIRSE